MASETGASAPSSLNKTETIKEKENNIDLSKLNLNSDPQITEKNLNSVSEKNETESKGDTEEVFEEALNEEEFSKKLLEQAIEEKSEGNSLYKLNDVEGALTRYMTALDTINSNSDSSSLELKSVLYSNSAACYLKLEKFDDVVKECTSSLELKETAKARMRRATAYEKLEKYEDALLDLKKVNEIDPNNREVIFESMRLQDLVNKRREEMMGKLKDLGNSILGKFGMSLDNFKSVKDPNTGGYSVSFQK